MDFTKICRLCLEINKQSYNIFTSYYMKRNTLYSEMISRCTKLKPIEEDGLPRNICKNCCRRLKRTYAFNILCEESDKKLRSHLKNENQGTRVNESINSTIESDSIDIKDEVLAVNQNDQNEDANLLSIFGCKDNKDNAKQDIKDDIQYDIKTEPNLTNDGDDCHWDDDDDNVLLKELRSTSKTEKDTIEENSSELDNEKPKRKRGRKKKVYNGEAPGLPESKLPHQCDVCGKFLSTKSNLKAHKICHTNLRPYNCTECPATFRGHSALSQHKKTHSGETPYPCPYCPKQFGRRTGLINHVRIHTGDKQYGCDICFKTFVQSAQLSIHMKRHKGDKTFLCQDCGKGFPIQADLKVHQRIHNGEKPYSCHLCTKSFSTSGNLSIHVRIHNKEIRYKCKECQRGFVTCSAYNVHLKRHKGQRDYICDCGKDFYTSSALKQHKVVHTGEKRYQCKICDRKFTQTSHLSRHFKRDHAKPNAPVPSSDHYKIIIKNHSDVIFQLPDVSQQVESDLKCERS